MNQIWKGLIIVNFGLTLMTWWKMKTWMNKDESTLDYTFYWIIPKRITKNEKTQTENSEPLQL